jgi:hypothetical protein
VTDLCATDAVTLAGMLRHREVSARDVVAAPVQRIEVVDGAVNAVVTRTFGAALDRSARADEALARGPSRARCTACRSPTRIFTTRRGCAPPRRAEGTPIQGTGVRWARVRGRRIPRARARPAGVAAATPSAGARARPAGNRRDRPGTCGAGTSG